MAYRLLSGMLNPVYYSVTTMTTLLLDDLLQNYGLCLVAVRHRNIAPK